MARSLLTNSLPRPATTALQDLGARLRRARIARGWTIDDVAGRLFVTAVTVRRLEAGHPGTRIGLLATALFLFELLDDLNRVATLDTDRVAAAAAQARIPARVRVRGAPRSLKF